MSNELETFLRVWDKEADKTLALIRALPEGSYDFRPDPSGRSIGEMAWHLAEGDAYMSAGIAAGKLDMTAPKPPGIERPRTIAALAPGYARVHAEAKARLQQLEPEALGRKIPFFDGTQWSIGEVLWEALLFHHIHHRGQLSTLCRLAGGCSPGMYGPNREEMAAMRANAGASA
jgi:uncharacterized damage-inducible protein DinB